MPSKVSKRNRRGRSGPRVGRFLTPGTKVTKLVRTNHVGALSRAAADSGWGWSWTIGDLPSYSELSALFRRFRIDQVDLVFTMTAVAVSATIVSYPVLYIAVDYSDASAPASQASLMERKHRTLAFNQGKTKHTVSIKPRLNTTDGAVLPPTMFTSSTSDVYYGVKFWIDDYNSTSANGRITLSEVYHLSLSDEH